MEAEESYKLPSVSWRSKSNDGVSANPKAGEDQCPSSAVRQRESKFTFHIEEDDLFYSVHQFKC